MIIRTRGSRAGTAQRRHAGLSLAAATAVSALLIMMSGTPASAVPPALVFDAHAHGGKVTSALVNVSPLAPSDLNCTATPATVTNNLAAASLAGLAAIVGINTSASGTVDGAGLRTATAQTKTAQVAVLGSLVSADSITATATATDDATGNVTTSGSAQLVNLRVNGIPIANAGANTTIAVPAIGTVYINEQVTTTDGAGISVNAIRVHLDVLNADIVVAHARASLTPPGGPCPIN